MRKSVAETSIVTYDSLMLSLVGSLGLEGDARSGHDSCWNDQWSVTHAHSRSDESFGSLIVSRLWVVRIKRCHHNDVSFCLPRLGSAAFSGRASELRV